MVSVLRGLRSMWVQYRRMSFIEDALEFFPARSGDVTPVGLGPGSVTTCTLFQSSGQADQARDRSCKPWPMGNDMQDVLAVRAAECDYRKD